MVTLKDIAERLNVSIPLVSKVLNNSRSTVGVSEQTAERIRQAAGEMGYVRNRSAVALRKGRHDSIGVLVQLVGAPGVNFTEQILSQVSEVAMRKGQQMQLGFYHTDEEFFTGLSRMTRAAVDGIIVSGVGRESLRQELLTLSESGLPVVTLGVKPISPDIVNIGCSEQKLAATGVRHLIERGCRDIAHLTMLDDRCQGYREELEANGLPVREELIVPIQGDQELNEHVSMDAGVNAVRELLARGVAFDGITTQCDAHAMAAIKVLYEAGLTVPRDVKVIGMDNSPVCDLGLVSLSSVDPMMRDRAMAATEMILRARNGEKLRSVMFDPVLFARQSTAL